MKNFKENKNNNSNDVFAMGGGCKTLFNMIV